MSKSIFKHKSKNLSFGETYYIQFNSKKKNLKTKYKVKTCKWEQK
jgi:hypothetical protein